MFLGILCITLISIQLNKARDENLNVFVLVYEYISSLLYVKPKD